MRRLFGLFHDIFEEGKDFPSVRHVFLGRTPEEAQSAYERHLTDDAYLRGAEAGRYGDTRLDGEYELVEVEYLSSQDPPRLAAQSIDPETAWPEPESK